MAMLNYPRVSICSSVLICHGESEAWLGWLGWSGRVGPGGVLGNPEITGKNGGKMVMFPRKRWFYQENMVVWTGQMMVFRGENDNFPSERGDVEQRGDVNTRVIMIHPYSSLNDLSWKACFPWDASKKEHLRIFKDPWQITICKGGERYRRIPCSFGKYWCFIMKSGCCFHMVVEFCDGLCVIQTCPKHWMHLLWGKHGFT